MFLVFLGFRGRVQQVIKLDKVGEDEKSTERERRCRGDGPGINVGLYAIARGRRGRQLQKGGT